LREVEFDRLEEQREDIPIYLGENNPEFCFPQVLSVVDFVKL
jgi:hypothetical protein